MKNNSHEDAQWAQENEAWRKWEYQQRENIVKNQAEILELKIQNSIEKITRKISSKDLIKQKNQQT